MSKDSDSGWGLLLGALAVGAVGAILGYVIGAPNREDAERIRKRNERAATLKNQRVIIPIAALKRTQNGYTLYKESVSCYLSGAPNGAFDNVMQVLEITLKKKYDEVELKSVPTKLSLYELIEWGEKFLKQNKVIAHNFRIQRKLIHYDATRAETSSLNAIIHISNLLNILYPYDTTNCYYTCNNCNGQEYSQMPRDQYYFGNSILVNCLNNPAISFSIVINQ